MKRSLFSAAQRSDGRSPRALQADVSRRTVDSLPSMNQAYTAPSTSHSCAAAACPEPGGWTGQYMLAMSFQLLTLAR
jgi:hypothetical protein